MAQQEEPVGDQIGPAVGDPAGHLVDRPRIVDLAQVDPLEAVVGAFGAFGAEVGHSVTVPAYPWLLGATNLPYGCLRQPLGGAE